MKQLTEEEAMAKIQLMQEDFENCDCKGSPARPWDYCDDCQEYRKLVDSTMEEGEPN
jgi:hypothetical protein